MAKIENKDINSRYYDLGTCDVLLFDKSGLEIYSSTTESYEIAQAVEEETITGGIESEILCVLDKSKSITIKVGDVCAKRDLQTLKLGSNTIETGETNTYHMPKNYTLTGSGNTLTVALDYEPVEAEPVIAVYNNNTDKMIEASKVTVSTKTITITGETGLKAGDTVFVTSYECKVPNAEFANISSSSSKMPELSCVMKKYLYGSAGEIKKTVLYEFPKVKVSGNVTISGQSEKQKNVDETNITVIKDNTKDYLGRIIWIDGEA